ncbi:hypothetical protein V6N13_009995 [Hibiscus sabdariffa]
MALGEDNVMELVHGDLELDGGGREVSVPHKEVLLNPVANANEGAGRVVRTDTNGGRVSTTSEGKRGFESSTSSATKGSEVVNKRVTTRRNPEESVLNVASMGKSSKGRVLSGSIIGLSQASSSKGLLGVKGGSNTGLKILKKDVAGKSHSALAGRLSTLVSDLNQAADGENR